MQEDDFWQIEQACRDAWPAVREERQQGWLFRISGGETRRTNSVNATPDAHSIHDVLTDAETFFTRYERPLLFRTLSFQPAFENELLSEGFCDQAETVTLRASLEEFRKKTTHSVELTPVPTSQWVSDKLRLTPMAARQEKAYRFMLKNLRVPVAFARGHESEEGISLAYGAISQDMLIIESVVTDVAHRGKQWAEATVGALLEWGSGFGVRSACLQVVADNAPGHALYRKLGFTQELYRYRYWQSGK
jgi:N-acetylglutamate synthase